MFSYRRRNTSARLSKSGRRSGAYIDRTDLSDVADHGNTFTACKFARTKLIGAVLGYEGSEFSRCRFANIKLGKAAYIRAEFDSSAFENCDLRGADFNGCSFEKCSFEGQVVEAWFRGGFALPSDEEQYGAPRANRMEQVDFVNAELHNLTFSNGCDLSTVKMPRTEGHYRFDRWFERLRRLQESGKGELTEEDRKQVEIFVNSHLVHAREQSWYILNEVDLVGEHGKSLGAFIIRHVGAPL